MNAIPSVFAITSTVNSTWCSGAGFSWDSGTSTCTLSTSYTVNSGDVLVIPNPVSGYVTLNVASGGSITILSAGELENDGVFQILAGGSGSNSGKISDDGTFMNEGTFTSGGTITVTDTFSNDGTFTSSGTIDSISPAISTSSGTFVNSGTIKGDGFSSDGTLTNSGTITIGTTGPACLCLEGGVLTNLASGSIEIYGDIFNFATIDNYGTITANPGSNITNFYSGTINDLCGGTLVIDQGATFTQQPGSIFTTQPYCSAPGVPQFPVAATGPLLLTALLLPLLLLTRRKARNLTL